MIDVEAEAGLVGGGRDAADGEGRRGRQVGATEAVARVVEAVDPLGGEEQGGAGRGDVFSGDAEAAFLRGVFLGSEARGEGAAGFRVGVGGRAGNRVGDEGRGRDGADELLGWAVEAEAGAGGLQAGVAAGGVEDAATEDVTAGGGRVVVAAHEHERHDAFLVGQTVVGFGEEVIT